jgi:OOP family OmpA-OmpF porin
MRTPDEKRPVRAWFNTLKQEDKLMLRHLMRIHFFALVSVALIGCATSQPVPDFKTQKIDAAGYKQKADNFMIVYDASSSMNEDYNGHKKHAVAMAVLTHLNQSIPANLTLKSAIRTFGHAPGVSSQMTELFLPLTDYSATRFEETRLKFDHAGGTSPMDQALKAVVADLGPAHGKTALIVISDGEDMGPATLAAAREIKKAYGDRVCIYAVLVGDASDGIELMQNLAAIDQCGDFIRADSLLSEPAMAAFARQVFLGDRQDRDGDGVPDDVDQCPETPANVAVDQRGCPFDTDGDGVPDYKDRCAGTPAGVSVDMYGCPSDADGDGVPDYKDKCPNTPRGVVVDQSGCAPLIPSSAIVTSAGTYIFKDVQFDSGKWSLKPSSFPVLDQIAATLKEAADLKVEIQGHTDNRGKHAYNLDLSQKRADAVRVYLIKAGVPAARLTSKGFGPDQPMASNATMAGRAENRRVEFKPLR